jgi:hypothetical protein
MMSMNPREAVARRAIVPLLIIATVTAMSGCTLRRSASPAQPALTQAQAIAVVRSYAAGWARVISKRDRAALRRIQTGTALAVMTAYLNGQEALHEPAGEAPELREATVVVPRQERPAFPAHFLALVTWTSLDLHPYRDVLEFEQPSRGAPWRVQTQARLVDNVPLPSLAIGAGGFATLVDARDDKQLRFGAKALAELLSSYYADDDQQVATSRAAYDTTVAQGPFTSGLTKRRAAANQDYQLQQVRQYQPGAYRTAAYRLSDGGGLLMLTLAGTRQMFPRDRQVVPLIRQDGSRHNLGGMVPPGAYSAVDYQTTTMLAVEVPPAGSKRQLRVLAWEEQDTSATTSPP